MRHRPLGKYLTKVEVAGIDKPTAFNTEVLIVTLSILYQFSASYETLDILQILEKGGRIW
jgi:hypothetical protein